MTTIGKRFSEERKKRSLSLDEVAQRTKIRKLYLEKLEQDDFDGLPQEVYTRGFVRNLARLYGLEEQDAIDLYVQTRRPESAGEGDGSARTREEPRRKSRPEPPPERIANRKNRLWVSGVLICLALAVLLLYGWRAGWFGADVDGQQADPAPIEEPEDVQPEDAFDPGPALPEEEPAAPAEPDVYEQYDYRYITPVRPEEALDIMIRVDEQTGSRCWVSVLADGREAFTGTLAEGDVVRVFAEETVQLTLGDAGVVTLYRDGEEIGLDARSGDVVYRDFVKE